PGVEAIYLRITSGRAVLDEFLIVTSSALAPAELARTLLARWGLAAAARGAPRTHDLMTPAACARRFRRTQRLRQRHLPALAAAACASASASASTRINDGAAVTATVPVLMYHRIAAEGPPALARWRLHPR